MPYREDGVGYQERDTSKKAAADVSEKAKTIRQKVLSVFEWAGDVGLTADQAATQIARHYGSVRPRVTELINEGRLEDTGRRAKGQFGKMQIVWRIKEGQKGETK